MKTPVPEITSTDKSKFSIKKQNVSVTINIDHVGLI